MLKLLAAPLAGAGTVLVCALALEIEPLVSAIVGALVWGGVQLVWGPRQGLVGSKPAGPLSPGQSRQVEAALSRLARLRELTGNLVSVSVARRLETIAGRADKMIARLHADPGQFEIYRKALGNYLALALELAERLWRAEADGRADADMVSRVAASFGRLDALFSAVEGQGATMDRIDLDARIAVLEAEIADDLTLHSD